MQLLEKSSKIKSKKGKVKHVQVRFGKRTYNTCVLSKQNHYSYRTHIYINRLKSRASENRVVFFDFIGFYL